jgi:hypothetical protein
MSWIFAVSIAHAGTAVWLAAPIDPEQTPGDKARRVEAVAPVLDFGPADEAAIEGLRTQLSACRPMMDEFDGELSIIRQLDVRLDAVAMLREEDRDLIWDVLLLQGLAVHRYFPDLSTAEASGADVVRTIGADIFENAPWADAIALFPDRVPDASQLGDESSRVAFQEQRARALLWPTAELRVEGLPQGARLLIDGRAAPGGARTVIPGMHRWVLEADGGIQLRGRAIVQPRATLTEPYLATASEIQSLEASLMGGRGAVALPPAVTRRLDTLDGPVSIVVRGPRDVHVFRVEGESAVPVTRERRGASESAGQVWLMGGASWLYDGNFFVHNVAEGAPDDPATVNALAPVVGVGGHWPVGPVHLGAGTDLVMPLGAFHTVPTDDTKRRARLHPHGAVGWGPVSATVGFMSPWHLGLGLRGAVPVRDQWSVTGAFVQGVGLSWAREDGPEFRPEASRMGWVGMARAWPE